MLYTTQTFICNFCPTWRIVAFCRATWHHIKMLQIVAQCGALWRIQNKIVAPGGATILSIKKKKFATFCHISLHFATWQFVAICGDM